MAKVVIDANVIVSAAFGGKPLEAVGRALREHDVFISESILEELRGVLKRLSRKLSPEQIRYLQEKVEQLLQVAHRIPVSAHLSLSRDGKDDHYLSLLQFIFNNGGCFLCQLFVNIYKSHSCSFAGKTYRNASSQADFLITGDKDLLNLGPEVLKKNGIACLIITPATFLEMAP